MKEVKKQSKIKTHIIPITLIVISDIIICLIYYITKYLKKVNCYELYYYFKSDTRGTGIDIFLDGIKVCFLIFIILFILLYIPISNSKKIKMKIGRKQIYPNVLGRHKILYSFILFLISLLILGKTLNFDKFYVNTKEKTTIYENYYKDTNEVKITFPDKKKNLIILYLESMESSLMSKENGGAFKTSRIPELEELALNNINFSNTEKIGGAYNLDNTSWTIASAVAGSTGTPLMTTIRNRYRQIDEFMPNVRALGDVLKSEGYNLEIIQGSNINFSGTKKYYKTHGGYKIFDYNTAKKRGYISDDYKVWWGYEDKKLFEYTKKEILELASLNEPFSTTIFTMDTHFKDGYLDTTCEEKFDDQMSNVFACSSKMVSDFIEWIQEQDFYKDTTIVILGDHLTMQHSYYNDYPDYTRSIYNAFINTDYKSTVNKNREFSSLDMYPTILASIGAKIDGDQLGFGVNLFSGKKTMIEILGKEKFNDETLKSSDYYSEHILDYKELKDLNK